MKYVCMLCAIVLVCCCVPVASAVSYTFDSQWGTQGSALGQFNYPNGIAVGFDQYGDRGERVYVADTYNDRVVRFRTDGTGPIDWDGSDQYGLDPFDNVIDVATTTADFGLDVMAGDFYVTDASDRVLRFDSAGMRWGAWGGTGTDNGKFQSIGGLAIDSSGNIYVADTGNNRIQKFNPVGVFLSAWGGFGTDVGEFNGPTDVAVDSTTGDVYVADSGNTRVQKFTPSGSYVKPLTIPADEQQFLTPMYITTDINDNVFVTDQGAHRVHMFNSAGEHQTSWGGLGINNEPGLFWFPKGIAVDSAFNVFVVDSTNHRIQKFTRSENTPPVLTTPVAAPTPIDEGSDVTISGSFADPDADEWTVTVDFGDNSDDSVVLGTDDVGSDGHYSFSLKHAYADNGTYNVDVTVDDGQDTDTETIEVEVQNVEPSVGGIIVSTSPVAVNTPVTASASFTDPGAGDCTVADPHTAVWDWGDVSRPDDTVTVTEPEDSTLGSTTGSHTYMSAGIYKVSVTVTDKDGGAGSSSGTAIVVVYDPNGGFATGGGWFDSPAGAYTPDDQTDADVVGKAHFVFVSKYGKDATQPASTINFVFKAADFEFQSTSNEFLVVRDSTATYRGTGTLNGEANYGFLLSVADGSPDTVRIQIQQPDGGILYDNQVGDDEYDPPRIPVNGGNVVVHN